MDWLFAGFKWWRKFKGGIWWAVDIPTVGGLVWTNKKPTENERICWQEQYPETENKVSTLSDRELYFCVCNIARNGQWKDSLNLGKFLLCARLMRDNNIPTEIIIEQLTEVYNAAQREVQMHGKPRDHAWEEMGEILEGKFN